MEYFYNHLSFFNTIFLEINYAVNELMRGLPYCTDTEKTTRKPGEWYYDFLDACLSHGKKILGLFTFRRLPIFKGLFTVFIRFRAE